MIDKPGSYCITNEEYHKDPCIEPSLSRGVCMDLLNESCARAWWNHPRLNPDFAQENDKKFSIGSAAHAMFLEGLDIASVVDAKDWRTKASQEERDAAYAEGKVPLLTEEYKRVEAMVTEAWDALAGSELEVLISEGDSELSYFWQEGRTWLRVRPDWLSTDKTICLDYKTISKSANPSALAGYIINMGYDVQSAFYKRGIKAVDGVDTKFCFMFQEVEPPHLCSFVSLPPDFDHMGRMKVNHAIGLWEQCMASGKWPGYPSRICYPDLPAWAENWQMNATFIGSEEDEL